MEDTLIKCNDGIWREDPAAEQVTEPRFYEDDGFLSPYGFACGYIERASNGDNRVKMWREHLCYHILVFYEGETIFWDVFDGDYARAKQKFLEYSNTYASPL